MNAEPVRFGVLGVGGMGAAHATYIAQMEETRLVAVADLDEKSAGRVACEHGVKAYTDYRQLIDAGGIEAVVVATPHPFHPAMTEYAARHGIHVLCEKPIAVSVAAADNMIASCRAGGVLLGIVFQQRTEPSRRAMKRLIDRGVLGELYRVSMTVSYYRPQAYYEAATWRGTWKGEGGGVLMNQAAHALDQMVWMGGLPQRVQSMTLTRLHEVEVENTALALLDYGADKAGWFHTSSADLLGGERIEVSGESGALVWEDGRLRHLKVEQPLSQHLRTSPGMFDDIGGTWHNIEVEEMPSRYPEVLRAFARAVRYNDASLMYASGEDGLRALELANAILLSGRCRKEVELPLGRDHYERLLQTLQSGGFIASGDSI
jgi:predicted dehydrogenase